MPGGQLSPSWGTGHWIVARRKVQRTILALVKARLGICQVVWMSRLKETAWSRSAKITNLPRVLSPIHRNCNAFWRDSSPQEWKEQSGKYYSDMMLIAFLPFFLYIFFAEKGIRWLTHPSPGTVPHLPYMGLYSCIFCHILKHEDCMNLLTSFMPLLQSDIKSHSRQTCC